MATAHVVRHVDGTILFTGQPGQTLCETIAEAAGARTDLPGAYLRNAPLAGVCLRETVLRGADLFGACLTRADLFGADLRRAVLRRGDLKGADLRRAVLTGADLTEADLAWADLRGADLTGANLTRANLRGADLTEADLRDADLSGASRAYQDPLVAVEWVMVKDEFSGACFLRQKAKPASRRRRFWWF